MVDTDVGTATLTLSTQANAGVLGVAILRRTMDFTYLMAMQLYVSFLGLAAVGLESLEFHQNG